MGKNKEMLQMFAEGFGAESAGAAETGEMSGAETATTEVSAEESRVAAGNEAEDSQPAAGTQAEETFDDLIKGRFKKDYDARVQKAVKDRVKNLKGAKERLDKMEKANQILAMYYGVDADDAEALANAVEHDDRYFEDKALEMGLDVGTYRNLQQTRMENERLTQYKQNMEAQESARKIIAQWKEQAESAKALYPGLDLDAELGNEQFAQILKAGVDVKTAYEIVHKDEILQGFGQHVAKTVEQKVVNSVKSGKRRPDENGFETSSGVVAKTSVGNMTDQQIKELIRRAERGERIEF